VAKLSLRAMEILKIRFTRPTLICCTQYKQGAYVTEIAD